MSGTDPRAADWLKTLNGSGFPFQMAVSGLVKRTSSVHGWRTRLSEHGWHNADTGASGFLDAVLMHDRHGCALVVECKRAKKDGEWIFLVDAERSSEKATASAWRAIDEPTVGGWVPCHVDPPSVQSEFCVVASQGQNNAMLERIAGELVQATAAFGADFSSETKLGYRIVHVPVVVTNANLVVAKVQTEKITLEGGEVRDCEFDCVQWIRFRKQLPGVRSTESHSVHFSLERRMASMREATVFVVNAGHLPRFLEQFGIETPPVHL